MRLLAVFLVTAIAQAATITCPGFVVGPIAFTNCSTTNTATPGFPEMGFNWAPAAYPYPDFPPDPGVPPVVLLVPGRYTLGWEGVPKSVSENLRLDFAVTPGFALAAIWAVGSLGDSGVAVSEDITLSAPCSATLSPDRSANGCTLPAPLQEGTLSVTLQIRASGCGGGPCSGIGTVQLSHVTLYLQEVPVGPPVPEPGTMLLVGLTCLGTALRGKERYNYRREFDLARKEDPPQ